MKNNTIFTLILSIFICCCNPFMAAGDNYANLRAIRNLRERASKLEGENRYEEALSLLYEADQIGGNRNYFVKSEIANAISRILITLGRYTDAVKAYNKAMEYAVDQAQLDEIKLKAGDLYHRMGNYKEGYDVLCTIRTDSLSVRRNIQLSKMLCGLGEYGASIDTLKSAYKLHNGGRLSHNIAQNIGFVYWTSGDLDSAEVYMKQAITDIKRHSNSRDYYTDYYTLLENCAMIHSYQGRHSEAIAEMAKANKYFSTQQKDYQISLRKYAEVLTRAGMTDKAKPYFKQYFYDERSKILLNLPEMTLQQRLNLWAKHRPLLSKCFMLEDEAAELLFKVAMFRRQISLLGKADFEMHKQMLSVTPKQVRAKLNSNEAAVELIRYEDRNGEDWYAAVILPKNGDARFVRLMKIDDLYEPEIVGNNSLYNVIKREDRDELNRLYTDKELGNRVWGPILSVLPRDVKRIFFAPEGIFHMWGIENMPFDNKANIDLYRVSSIPSLIVRTEQQPVTMEIQRKLIVGGLDYDIMPEDSISSKTPDHEARTLLSRATGNEQFCFKYLKGTQTEVDTIAVICKTEAYHKMSEATITKIMSEYGVIHLATHGYSINMIQAPKGEFMLDSEQYDNSLSGCGLALSGANVSADSTMEDGILSAREICDLDLSGVSFVVLSACQTAKGDILDDGVAGIVRGLKNAGVKTILATLWSIDDTATLLFMQEFYKQLSLGNTPHQALCMAQRCLATKLYKRYYRKFSPKTLASESKQSVREMRYNEPYYYAPFILIDAI